MTTRSGPALPLVMSALGTFLTAAWFRPDRYPAGHLLISEEGYHVTADLPSVLLYRRLFKTSRNGLANVMMLHEADDLGGSADAHTALSKAVRALFAATSTFVVHALPEAKVHDLIAAGVPLSRTAVQTIPTLGRGIAWWQRGRRGGPRQTLLSDLEARLTDTDSAMTAGRAA